MPLPRSLIEGTTGFKQLSNDKLVFLGNHESGTSWILKYERKPTPPGGGFPDKELPTRQAQWRRSFAVIAELYSRVCPGQPAIAGDPASTAIPGFPEHKLLSEAQGLLLKELDSLRWDSALKPALNVYDDDQDPRRKTFLGFFIAMECVQDLYDFDWAKAKATLSATEFAAWQQARLATLTERKFRTLGKIAAVDILVGNRDRFLNLTSAAPINNAGNIFFSGKNQFAGDAVALDFFDPNSQWLDLYSPLSVAKTAEAQPYYSIDILGLTRASADFQHFGINVVKQIGDALGVNLFNGNFVAEFIDGFEDGIKALQVEILNWQSWNDKKWTVGGKKVTPYPPRQLWIRAKHLGWPLPKYDKANVPAVFNELFKK